jgi:hypothetical protein
VELGARLAVVGAGLRTSGGVGSQRTQRPGGVHASRRAAQHGPGVAAWSRSAAAEFFLKKGLKKIKIRKRGSSWEKFEKWEPPA